MKKITLAYLSLLIALCTSAQTPQALNYQAIARNSMGQMIPAQNIGVRFTIQEATGGTILYQETQSTTTNNFGLFTLAIGKGSVVSGSMNAIDWSTGGDKMLKVEIAPQGGTNYTMQGLTQLLSVPYALYAEKTKLIGGNAITITNGNTIAANYQAGTGVSITGNTIAGNYQAGTGVSITGNTIAGNYQAGAGITITGNTISATAGNSWLLNGNAGTTATNFIGTTDNQPFRIRTNNINRFLMDGGQAIPGGNFSIAYFSDFANIKAAPVEVAVFSKDISGTGLPMHIFGSVEGMAWSATGGTNNTLGRILRMSQMPTSNYTDGKNFDFGIDQGSSFYITDQSLNTTGGITPKKMITISPQQFVGINFGWGENPTANFHTKGSIRFEGVNTNNALARVLVMDANGNVSSRDAGTFGGGFWVADANGIRNNNTGHVGIGGPSKSINALNVEMMDGTTVGNSVARFSTNDTWQTNLELYNTSNNASYHIVAGGSANTLTNYGVGLGNFGIINVANGSKIPLIITTDNKVGIGQSLGGTDNTPKARLQVSDGDVYINTIGSGVIMKSPNGQCWRMTVSNAGAPVFTAIPCP